MALSSINKIKIRDHLCVPFAGLPMSGYTSGLRTILTVGQLESYMNLLQVEEEIMLTGYPFAQINILGQPAAGTSVISATVNGVVCSYTATAADATQNKFPLGAMANGLAQAINTSAAGIAAATGYISSSDVNPAAAPAFSQVTMSNPVIFAVTAVSGAGGVNTLLVANGSVYPTPSVTFTDDNGNSVPCYGYIAICDYLLARIATSDSRLGLSSAGGKSASGADVVFRKDEIERRVQLYDFWRTRMGVALSVGPNPAGRDGMGSRFGLIV